MRESVVIWDVDGTIISRSLEQHFLKYLIRRKKISIRRLIFNILALIFHWPPSLRWYRLKLAYLHGMAVDETELQIESCWNSVIKNNLLEGIPEVIKIFRLNGAKQLLLSGAPMPLVKPLAERLDIAEIIAAEPEIKNNFYTGSLVKSHPWGKRKEKIAADWLQSHGLDWSNTIAFANHWSDKYLLSKVRFPVAVYPDRRLNRYCQKNGWLVIKNPEDFLLIVDNIYADKNARA